MTLEEEIQNGESRTLEYKVELPLESQKWVKTIVAFANGAGGKFVLGVNNSREIGDMLRVNFYRPFYKKIGDKSEKSAINSEIGDKSVITPEIGDKSGDKLLKTAINPENGDKIGDKSEKFRARIVSYLAEHPDSKTQDISLYIGLKLSRTRDFLSDLAEEGKIVANGANKNRTYSLK